MCGLRRGDNPLDESATVASLSVWLSQQYANANIGVSKTINPHTLPPTVTEDDEDDDGDVELGHANSLTRQLGAIDVLEMNEALSQFLLPPSPFTSVLHLHLLAHKLHRSCTRPLQPL